MKKSFSYLLVVLTAVVVLLAGVFLVSQQHLANTTTRTAKVKPSRPKQTVPTQADRGAVDRCGVNQES